MEGALSDTVWLDQDNDGPHGRLCAGTHLGAEELMNRTQVQIDLFKRAKRTPRIRTRKRCYKAFALNADSEERAILRVQLRDETGFPGEILPHRVQVSGVSIVDEEQIVDARVVGRRIGRSGGVVPGACPCVDPTIEQPHVVATRIVQIERRKSRDFGFIRD